MRQCDIGIVHLCLEVNDAQQMRESIVKAGFETISEVQVLRDGRAKAFYCRGPDDIVVEFLELVKQSWFVPASVRSASPS